MSKQLYINNFEQLLVGPVKDAPTTGSPSTELDYGILRLSNGASGTLLAPGADYYVLTLLKRSGSNETNIEIVKVTAVDNSTPGECRITVDRAQEGTTAKAFIAGDYATLRFTKGSAENMVQAADLSGHVGAGGAAHANVVAAGAAGFMTGADKAKLDSVSGSNTGDETLATIKSKLGITTLSGSNTGDQDLSGKQDVLVSATNIKTVNGTTLLGAGNLAVGTVTLAGTETLTNKTLTGYTETVYALSGTVIDPVNGTVQTKTLAANTTFTESLADGQSLVLMLNPATYTTTWPTTSWVRSDGAGTAPTLKASVVNTIVLWQVGGVLYGNFIGSM